VHQNNMAVCATQLPSHQVIAYMFLQEAMCHFAEQYSGDLGYSISNARLNGSDLHITDVWLRCTGISS